MPELHESTIYMQTREAKRILREADALGGEMRGLIGLLPGAALAESALAEAVYESCKALDIPYVAVSSRAS